MIEELFQDRLDAFLEKSLSDIVQFATREERPVEEIRRCVAEWHARYLFTESESELTNNSSKLDRARTIRIQLNETSRALETLNATTGMHSLLLAVDPLDASDPGFVYGTAPARDFWRGLRGGGEKGISALRSQARKTLVPPTTGTTLGEGTSSKGPAYKLKTEVYSRVRSALRTVSGVPNADMKWTNHENLLTYGVRIEGWPPEIPLQNPSTLSVAHNNAVKAALDAGTLRFRRIEDTAPDPPPDTQLPWDLLDESLRPDIPTVPHASSELLVHPASIMVASAQRSSGENDITSNG